MTTAGRWTATYENDCTGYVATDWADALERALDHEGGDTGNLLSIERDGRPTENGPTATCKHCGRTITLVGGEWVDTEATGDDAMWRETCDAHKTVDSEHEPIPDYIWPEPNGDGWIDAWNGWYDTLEHALEEAAGGDSRPWVLNRGEGLVDEDERERRDSVRKGLIADDANPFGSWRPAATDRGPLTLDRAIDEATEMEPTSPEDGRDPATARTMRRLYYKTKWDVDPDLNDGEPDAQHPDRLMNRYLADAKGEAAINERMEILWDIIADIQSSYRLAMENVEGHFIAPDAITEVEKTVEDYLANHYGDD